jgi:isopentenyl-diphosphate delta-isomerase
VTASTGGSASELVVLLDPAGRAVGTAAKAGVHHADTPLHLAFSCYVLDPQGRLLVTRRALGKTTFPALWTNSLCGHPAPGETLVDAVCRRARDELGLHIRAAQVELVLPEFGYRAEMDGVVEHELCPVLVARVDRGPDLRLERAEVAASDWMPWLRFAGAVLAQEPGWSPWCRQQVRLLHDLGPDPGDWPVGQARRLPPAARLR